MRALEKDPSERYASMTELAHALDAGGRRTPRRSGRVPSAGAKGTLPMKSMTTADKIALLGRPSRRRRSSTETTHVRDRRRRSMRNGGVWGRPRHVRSKCSSAAEARSWPSLRDRLRFRRSQRPSSRRRLRRARPSGHTAAVATAPTLLHPGGHARSLRRRVSTAGRAASAAAARSSELRYRPAATSPHLRTTPLGPAQRRQSGGLGSGRVPAHERDRGLQRPMETVSDAWLLTGPDDRPILRLSGRGEKEDPPC